MTEMTPQQKQFTEQIRTMQHAIHQNAVEHGWWDSPRSDGEIAMLVVTEIAEAVEAQRNGGGESEKIPGFTKEEEEYADAIIRILDFASAKGYRLGQAIIAKHVALQAGNGRDALVDAYHEALDMCMYLRQAIEERG